jgi:DNA processing protein
MKTKLILTVDRAAVAEAKSFRDAMAPRFPNRPRIDFTGCPEGRRCAHEISSPTHVGRFSKAICDRKMNSTEACIALNMLPHMGPVRLRKLLEVFETPENILTAKRSALRAIDGIGNEVAEQIANWETTVDLSAELERIRQFGAEVITAQSPTYPRQLREIHAPPIVLYFGANLRSAINTPSG